MLFSEIYSNYFNAVSKILTESRAMPISQKRLLAIVQEEAFGESVLNIPEKLQEEWCLLDKNKQALLEHEPTMPLSSLQLRFLKALSLDERIKLFDVDFTGLEDVEPLFTKEQFTHFDEYGDGDRYASKVYQKNFKMLLQGIRKGVQVRIKFMGGHGVYHQWQCSPYKLEYSSKDDKFRLLCYKGAKSAMVNVARIQNCQLTDKPVGVVPDIFVSKKNLVLEVEDERNALERVLLHFSHLEKRAEQIDEKHYRITLHYDSTDEIEMVIRVLSFGPFVKAVEPASFVEKVRERLVKQMECY